MSVMTGYLYNLNPFFNPLPPRDRLYLGIFLNGKKPLLPIACPCPLIGFYCILPFPFLNYVLRPGKGRSYFTVSVFCGISACMVPVEMGIDNNVYIFD